MHTMRIFKSAILHDETHEMREHFLLFTYRRIYMIMKLSENIKRSTLMLKRVSVHSLYYQWLTDEGLNSNRHIPQ